MARVPAARTVPSRDEQPRALGDGGVGYESGFRPRARYARSSASPAWKAAQARETGVTHCNIQPRISLAGVLDASSARALGVGPWIPGRVPAPRIQLGCGDLPESVSALEGALARDLLSRASQVSPVGPDGGPRVGPGPNPPGLGPQPPAPPAVPIGPPPAPPAPPIEEGPPGETPVQLPGGPPPSCRVPGTIAAVNFHFTQATAGGSASSELRVYGPIASPFIIREIWVNAEAGVTAGQLLDVLVSSDGDVTDTATPGGSSIFDLVENSSVVVGRDTQRGLSIPSQLIKLDIAARVDVSNQFLKVRNFFVFPAVALAVVHITLVIEELDMVGMVPPPLVPRPPLIPAVPPAPAPGLPPAAGPAPVVSIPGEIYSTGTRLYPAWRVAAQGLQPARRNGQLANYPALEAYARWLLDREDPRAESFRVRLASVLERAGVPGASPDVVIDLRYAIPYGSRP